MENKTNNEEKKVTGLDQATNRKEAEYDLVKALLEAAEFKTSDDCITEVDMKRNGKFMFTVHIHPVSETDARFARKKATTYMPNPNGRKLPQIEKEFNSTAFKSWLIYLATTPEDQEKIWGNTAVMQKYNLVERWETIDTILTMGEKNQLADLVAEISGINDDDAVSTDEEEMDQETFQ